MPVESEASSMAFDIWPPDDLLGTALGELTEATGKVIRVAFNQPGSGSFRINRNSDEFVMCATDSLVRVRPSDVNGPLAATSEQYFFAFVIEEGTDVVVSVDEEGGEVVELHGRSAEVLLERAVIDWEAHYADDIVAHPYDRTTLTDGQWHFDEAIPDGFVNIGAPGAVMRVLLRNAGAQVPEPIPYVSHDFSINNDSNGNPWEDGDGRFDFDVGMDLLSVLMALVEGGLYYRFTPALVLSAWDSAFTAQDVSATVIFEKGVNIRESGERDIHASTAKSMVLVKGSTKKGPLKYRWVNEDGGATHYEDLSTGAIEGEIGVRQGFSDYPYSPTNSRLDKHGRKYLGDRKFWHDGPPAIGVIETTDGLKALIDYFPGDTVGVTLPDIEPTAVVHAIILADNETGEYDPSIEFVTSTTFEDRPSSTVTPTSSPSGGSSYGTPGNLAGDVTVSVEPSELLLIWWTPAANDLLVDGSPAEGNANSGLSYMVGPGNYTISSPDTGTHFHFIVVTGTAYVDGDPDT